MNSLSSRLYKDETDFQIMAELISRVRPPEHLNDYPRKVDIEENLVSSVVRANARLWFDEGHLIGWAYVDEFNNIWWELEDKYQESLGGPIVEWGEACIRKALNKEGSSTLDTSCRENYAARIAFLKQHGFRQTDATTVRMVRPLSEPIPEPRLPPGFAIRALAGAGEAEAVAAMHRLAFGTDYMTTENRLAIMSTSEYDPSLDLVAVAPDGTLAGNCICSVNVQEQTGMTDPVATHPRYQQMGIARALLLTGLHLLKERGILSAHLGTSGDNIVMQKTAASVGFRLEYKTLWFSKEVC